MFDLCVEITVDESFTSSIDSFVIDWDDGTTTTIPVGGPVPPSPIPASIQHIYDFTDFFGTCAAKEDRAVFVYTHVSGNPIPLNNGFILNVLNPPQAAFTTSSPVCVGEAVTLNSGACPTAGLTTYPWVYGDGNSGTSGSHTYGQSGTYTVSLTVSNQCDTVTASQQVEVLELPVSQPVATEGVQEIVNDTLVVCLGDTISLNGEDFSQNETAWRWEILTSIANACFDYIPATVSGPADVTVFPNPRLVIFCEGVYRLELRVNNACDAPDTEVLVIRVVSPPDIEFSLFVSDCTPTLSIAPADYLQWTGEVTGCLWDFGTAGASSACDPGIITFDTTTTVTFTGYNHCDTLTATGQVTLTPGGQALILSPCADTLCSNDAPCTLSANLPGGNWATDGIPSGPSIDPAVVGPGLHMITYGAEPCIQPDTVYLYVIDAAVALDGPGQVCVDGGPATFTGVPAGGMFAAAGNSIDPVTGIFDPVPAGNGPVQITYTLPAAAFCPGTATLSVQVTALTVGYAVTGCDGWETCFAPAEGTSGFDAIQWDFGDGGASSEPTPCHTYDLPAEYTVTVTITEGICSADSVAILNVEEPPTADFSLDYATPACGPLAVTISDLSTGDNLQYVWELDSTTLQATAPGTVILAQSGAVSLTVSNGCGSSSLSEWVEVEPLPEAGFGANAYVCSGDTLEVFNVATLFDALWWDLGNGQSSADTGTQYVVYFTGADNDTLTILQVVENQCGSDTASQPVIVVPTDAEANVTTTAAPLFQVCQNESVCFESYSQPDGIPLQWDFGDGNTAIAHQVCHQWSQAGTYEVVARLVSCGFDSTVIPVTVLPAPVADFAFSQPVCPAEPLPFVDQSAGAVGYDWDFGNGGTSLLAAPATVYDSAGTYLVCQSVVSAGGCRDTACLPVIVSALPLPAFGAPPFGCVGEAVLFSGQSSPDVVACTWQFGDGNGSADCVPTHAYGGPGTFVVELQVSNGAGCTAAVAQPITIGAVPLPAFSYDGDGGCHPATVSFANASMLAVGYLWDFGDGATSTLTEPEHTFGLPGDYVVTLSAIAAGGCEAVVSQPVTVLETPDARLSVPQPAICAGEPMAFQSVSAGSVATYLWDFGDGTFSFSPDAGHIYQTPGSYSVILTVTGTTGCADADTLALVVHPSLHGQAAVTDVSCFGASTGSVAVVLSGGSPPFAVNWSDGSTGAVLSQVPAGMYSLTATDVNGCTWDSSMSVLQAPALQASLASDRLVTCAGGTDGSLCISVAGGTPGYSYAWETGGQSGDCADGLSAGPYSVSVTDANACVTEAEFEVRENPPIQFLDSAQSRSCFGEDDAFIDIRAVAGGVGGHTVRLEGPDGYAATGNRFGYLRPGDYLLRISDALGCRVEKAYQITEPDSIWLDILYDTVRLELGADTLLPIDHNLADPMYAWTPPTELDCTDCPEPMVRPMDSRWYRLVMTDGNGCTVQDAVHVVVDKVRTIYIPNIFTPNGDGRNDRFRVRTGGRSVDRVRHFQVTDRWGEVLFAAEDFDPRALYPPDGWDGTYRGERLPPDVYYYVAVVRFVDGEEKTYEGSVTLVR